LRVLILKKGVSTIGGSESHARALARTLAARGHEVSLVGLRPAWPRAGLEREAEFQEGGARVLLLPARYGAAGVAIDGLLPTALLDESVLRERVGAVDVVHAFAREYATIAERFARERGAAFVETPLVHPGQAFAGAGAADVRRYRRADAVLALTEWERGWYLARGVASERAHVTGVGPILGTLPSREPERGTILFVGRREPYKGYLALARAAPLVWRACPEARFLIIGQQPWHAPLTERAAPRADPRWVDLGVADEQAKAAAFAACTVFCMPSRHETFGQTYLEAWLARRPVIAGDIPPLREVVDGAGVCVPQHAGAVADAILALLADPTRARALGARGYERATSRYTWDAVTARVEAAYEAASSSRR
jgi:phosphatidylinositol alpha-1,6-mannosyltransferase